MDKLQSAVSTALPCVSLLSLSYHQSIMFSLCTLPVFTQFTCVLSAQYPEIKTNIR